MEVARGAWEEWDPSCCSTSDRASTSEGSVRAGCERENQVDLNFLSLLSTYLLSWLYGCPHNVAQSSPTVALELQRVGDDGEVHAGEDMGGTTPLH